MKSQGLSFPSMLLILIYYSRCRVDFNSIFMPYGDRWRLHRRFFHQTFRLQAVHRFLPYQRRMVCHLLLRLLETPEKPDDHLSK